MPLYEYQCTACHRRTEKIQKFSDAELTVCPHCGGTLERTLTAPAVQFKGSGWYKDLYSSAKPPASSGEGSSSQAAAGDNAGGTPAAKAETAPAATASAPAAAPASTAGSGSSGSSGS